MVNAELTSKSRTFFSNIVAVYQFINGEKRANAKNNMKMLNENILPAEMSAADDVKMKRFLFREMKEKSKHMHTS